MQASRVINFTPAQKTIIKLYRGAGGEEGVEHRNSAHQCERKFERILIMLEFRIFTLMSVDIKTFELADGKHFLAQLFCISESSRLMFYSF